MVDRPIKKSDREAAQQSQSTEAGAQEKRKVPPPIKKADRKDGGPASKDSRDERSRGGKGRGKGRGRGKGDAPKAPVNPALMRGPKPTKKVEEPEVVAEDATDEASTVPETADTTSEAETAPEAEATPEAAAAPEVEAAAE
ncbi:MAG: hypothetical protein AAGB19_16565, partial [Cyanobacteria bacterium P01_F01_bin.3]